MEWDVALDSFAAFSWVWHQTDTFEIRVRRAALARTSHELPVDAGDLARQYLLNVLHESCATSTGTECMP